MADNIQNRDEQWGTQQAWHKKTRIPDDGLITCERVYPYLIELEQVYRGKNMTPHNGWQVPVASDDGLPVGNGQPINLDTYSLQTPHECWAYVNKVLAGTKYQVVSAGTVSNRGRFFISTKLLEIEDVVLVNGDKIEIIFNFIGSLDRSLKIKLSRGSRRIVCENTLMMEFLEKQAALCISLKHTKNMGQKLEEKRPIVEAAVGYAALVRETFDALLKRPCNVDRATQIYTGFLTPDGAEEISTRGQGMIDQHVECFRSGIGNRGETESDLLNGFTQPRTRGYEGSKRDVFDVFATSEFGVYGTSKSEFASLLVNRRDELKAIEKRGKDLLAV